MSHTTKDTWASGAFWDFCMEWVQSSGVHRLTSTKDTIIFHNPKQTISMNYSSRRFPRSVDTTVPLSRELEEITVLNPSSWDARVFFAPGTGSGNITHSEKETTSFLKRQYQRLLTLLS